MADDGVTLKLTGHREIVAALKELRDELPRNYLRSALRKAATRMQKVIISFAPRRTLTLVNAIGLRTRSGAVPRAQVTVNTAGKRGDRENAFYWRFLEKGWHSRAGIPYKRPFVAPAVETEAQDAAQTVIDAVEAAIARAESRAKR
jgi:HK97 gp10 family phage protein